jgi:outer membrane protein assembly factor BamB
VNGRRLEEMWEFKTGDEVYSSPALGDMDNDGLPDVVVVSDDDRAYCIDGQDGKLIWEYEIGVDCNAGHPLLADVNADGLVDVVVDGTMYGGDLVVLKTDAKCMENAILWPKVYGNNRNTGSCGER